MILGTGKPVSHEIRLATWRYVDDSRRMTAICLNPKGKEINVRPESGGYPKGDAEVVDETFHHAPGHGVDKSRRQSEREFDFHHAPGHGVDMSHRRLDREFDFHHAPGHGVDKSSIDFD